MEILEIIKKRRSIRKFKSESFPKEMLEKLISALIWAPSAGNLQSRKFYFVFNQKLKEEIALASFGQMFIKSAPLVIVACGDKKIEKKYGERGKSLYMICDTSLSIGNLMLTAESLGLGTCFVGGFDPKKIKKILKLPEFLEPIAVIPVGYPAEKPEPPFRIEKESAIEILN